MVKENVRSNKIAGFFLGGGRMFHKARFLVGGSAVGFTSLVTLQLSNLCLPYPSILRIPKGIFSIEA